MTGRIPQFLLLLKSRCLSLIALFLLATSALVITQELTGILWRTRQPLTAKLVQEQEDGTYRFLLSSFNIQIPRNLERSARILEDGKPLTRVNSRNELSRSPAGCYALTKSSLLVAPRSGELRNLVARLPVVMRPRAKLVTFGATLLSLLVVAATTAERNRWLTSLAKLITATRNLTRRLARTATHQVASRPLLNDLAALALLALLAGALYFPLADRISHSIDGFLLSYLLKTGGLLPYNLHEVKEPGRPFIGLGWHIASVFGGGHVSGSYRFIFSCLLFSAMMVYAIIRTLLPNQPLWALLGSALKLVWMANFEIFDNSGLAIYFVESLFWLAFLLFVRTGLRRVGSPKMEFLSLAAIAASVIVVVGTYQTSWPIVLLFPLLLVGSGTLKWHSRRTYLLFSIWYLSAVPMMGWCASLSYSYAMNVSPSLREVTMRVLSGIWFATGGSILPVSLPDSGMDMLVNAGILATGVMFIWFGMGSYRDLQSYSRRQVGQVIWFLIFIGIAIIIGTLLPPSLQSSPTFGTRFMHWPAIGTILAIVAALAGLGQIMAPAGALLSASLAFALFFSMAQRAHDVGNFLAESSFANRRFWEDLIMELPKVQEGTVVLMDGPPVGIKLVDSFGTWVFRALTDTRTTFFLTESTPGFHPESQTYEIASDVDLNLGGVPGLPLSVNPYFRDAVFPTLSDEPQVFQVPGDRVVLLSWDLASRRLRIDHERSAMGRIIGDTPSVFGETLFPPTTAEKNRALGMEPRFR